MRVSKEEKARSNARIITEAARLFRENGIEATGLADVMEAAGLTHGGFYRHFSSKDELAAAAINQATDGYIAILEGDIEKFGADEGTKRFIDRYLSPKHVNTPAIGCPLASLGPECARGPKVCKEAIDEGTLRFAKLLALAFSNEPKQAHTKALGLLSTLIGTVILARSTNSKKTMNDILKAGQMQAMQCIYR